jgi:hypothetical protein
MLHITNGDSAGGSLRATGIPGQVIAWRDVLHEGPVPAGLALEALSDVRARFIAGSGWGNFANVRRDFGARDAALRGARTVVLWFEHDLYDQLQLIQILATLSEQPETKAEMICINAFPGIEPFHGLGQLTSPQLASLWPRRNHVSGAQLALGKRAWKAFTSPDPLSLRHLLDTNLDALPFLRAALERLREEFPVAPDGLSRTERQILQAVAAGTRSFADVFATTQRAESAPFMGDATLRDRIATLIDAPTPLLTREPYTLTPAGQRVLTGEVDARSLNPLDRWIGGVHLVQ